jgi:hypothetical protein
MNGWLSFKDMKWRSIVLIAFLAGSVNGPAQNLVPNGGFEEGVNCPMSSANLDSECLYWFSSIIPADELQPTPEWFHSCSEIDILSPPDVAFGSQEPATGGGYAGFVTSSIGGSSDNYREIIGVQLTEQLIVNQSYLVEFDITALDQFGFYCINNLIGFNFSTHQYYHRDDFPINQSHFAVDTVIPLSDQWIHFALEFTADSNYSFIHLGNFYDDLNTTTIQNNDLSQTGYYVLDNVSVSQIVSAGTGLKGEDNALVYPNPVSDYLNITIPVNDEILRIEILSMQGEMIKSFKNLNGYAFSIDMSQFPSNGYFFQIKTSKTIYYEKIIKISE